MSEGSTSGTGSVQSRNDHPGRGDRGGDSKRSGLRATDAVPHWQDDDSALSPSLAAARARYLATAPGVEGSLTDAQRLRLKLGLVTGWGLSVGRLTMGEIDYLTGLLRERHGAR